MKATLGYCGCFALVMALAAGCASTGSQPAAADQQVTQVEATSQSVLQGELARAGLCDTDLVFETTITFPVQEGGDKHPKPAWKGIFLGREQATLQAKDQLLVIAKTLQCNEVETRYVFNPFTRTWGLAAQRTTPEGNRLWVLFSGNASEFMHDVANAASVRSPLAETAANPKLHPATAFPVDVSVDAMLADLTEIGLSGLNAHLKAEHSGEILCNPDVHVYVKPAAGR